MLYAYLAHSQQGQPTATPTLYNGKIYDFTQYLQNDSGYFIALRDTNFIPKRRGLILMRPDSVVYVYNGARWLGIGVGGGAGVYNAGFGLVLTSGVFRVDTFLLATQLYVLQQSNLKLNKSDTATMLLPYLRKSDTASMLIPYLRKSDTSNMLSKYLRKYDTISMLSPYLRKASIAGTTDFLPKYTSSTSLGNSQIVDNGLNVSVGTFFDPQSKISIYNGVDATNIAAYFSTGKPNDATQIRIGVGGNVTLTGGAVTQSPSTLAFGAATQSTMYFQPTGNQVLWGTYSASNSNLFLSSTAATVTTNNVLASSIIGMNITDSCNYNSISALHIIAPQSVSYNGRPIFGGTITDYFGIFIGASDNNISTITNRYGIYQTGLVDVNYFAGIINSPNLPVFADNTAASSLPIGQFYRTSTGVLMVKF